MPVPSAPPESSASESGGCRISTSEGTGPGGRAPPSPGPKPTISSDGARDAVGVQPALDLDFVRASFPGLESGWAYLDNGGGSQIAQPVLDRLRDFLVTSNVQLGASYEPSRVAADRLQEAHRAVATLVHAHSPDEVVMGPSTTSLLRTLADSVGRTLAAGDEIVVTRGDHEANIAPWIALEERGGTIRWWEVDPETGELPLEALDAVLGPRTKLVAMTHASNILGSINPVREVARRVHAVGGWLCVDGVGFAPHRAVDVRALDVDFYAFSFYKTFGPHHAVLYGKKRHLLDLPGHGFYFVAEDDVPYKFQPGNVNYELSYALVGLMEYLEELATRSGDEDAPATGSSPGQGASPASVVHPRRRVEVAFDAIAGHEERLAARLLDFLASKESVRIIGPEAPDRDGRVPIVSFVSTACGSRDIVEAVDAHRIGIRFGHFYSARLVEALDLPDPDGVVRVSMVHYNTLDEIDRLIRVLDPLL